jgi:hypothetical protein
VNAQLEPPRWKNGPPICSVANLPAFDSKKDAADFLTANSPGSTVIEMWTCTACGMVHFWSVAQGPAGASSGTTREAKHIDELREKFLKSPVSRTMPKP